jgi:hypothetical protein
VYRRSYRRRRTVSAYGRRRRKFNKRPYKIGGTRF